MARTQHGNEDSRKDLGPSEKKTLHLYNQGYLTSNDIAAKRGLAPSTIRGHLASLRRKGYIGVVPGHKNDAPPLNAPSSSNKKYRLHGEEYNVQIINGSTTYQRAYKRGSDVVIDGNRVRLYRDSFEVYSGRDFWGVDAVECERLSSRYWHRFLLRLESTFNILLVKPGRHNIKRVKVHVAEVGNELAEAANAERERVRVKDDAGKEWLLADASFGFDELETVHGDTAVKDMGEVVAPFFNDLRDRPDGVQLPSQTFEELRQLRSIIHEIGRAVQVNTETLKTLLPSVPEREGLGDPDYFG